MNAEGLRARSRVLRAVRGWFDDHGYYEVPTPVLVPSPALEENLFAVEAGGGWLRTSPEFALKKVLAAGLPRIYEIAPCLRAREDGPWHAREFLMLEWYRAGAELDDLMDEVEQLVAVACLAVARPCPERLRRVTVAELFAEVLGIDLTTAGIDDLVPGETSWDHAFFRRWVDDIEPTLTGAVFVSDWPASQAALARVRTDRAWPTACRFEAYLEGVELANAFLELTDPVEQRRRFVAAGDARRDAGELPHPIDEALIDAVGRMPRTAGIALGLDRLVAAVSGAASIHPYRVAAVAGPTS